MTVSHGARRTSQTPGTKGHSTMTESNIIDRQTAANLIRQSGGKLIGVTFIKRGDRKRMRSTPVEQLPRRRLVGRLASTVTVDKTGDGARYNFNDHDLIPLYEFVTNPETTRDDRGRFIGGGSMARQYRAVPVEGIESIRVGGKTFLVR